jgi:hypothetical protein
VNPVEEARRPFPSWIVFAHGQGKDSRHVAL